MVNFLRWCHSSFLQALLAEGMRVNVSISYFLPAPAIPLLFFFGPSIFFILPIHQLLVLLAVPFLCKPRAARIGTRLLWFSWHLFTSTKKALRISPKSLQYYHKTVISKIRPRFYSLCFPRKKPLRFSPGAYVISITHQAVDFVRDFTSFPKEKN